MHETIEVVVFPAKKGVTSEQLLAASQAITPVFSAMPGFISREFGTSGDGQFIDVIHWRDRTAAELAAEKVMDDLLCCAYFDLMDQSRMQFTYFDKVF